MRWPSPSVRLFVRLSPVTLRGGRELIVCTHIVPCYVNGGNKAYGTNTHRSNFPTFLSLSTRSFGERCPET